MFREVAARPDYVELEQEALRLWAETRAFEKLREQTRGGPRWSFLDGPITANNPMGVHHAWGRTYKDLYNRYHAMLGQELRWQQGFDCQGLWVEVEVEKELGIRDKHQIEDYGVANFVNKCKERVYRYAAVQAEQSKRLGYWMDWDNSYFTLSDENNYSIWGFLKLCHERGWLYRGHDVMPWCPRCGTALSEHEIATEGYVEKTHLAVTVAFPLLDRPGEALLAWTTTPWTLPANVAAALHPELMYVRVTTNDELRTTNDERRTTNDELQSFWVAKDRLPNLQSSIGNLQVVEERPGADLAGWRYAGPFDELEAQAGVEHRVVLWSEVSADEGTGVVHIAPGAGKEDFALGREHGLRVLAPLDDNGVYVGGYGWLSGRKAGEVAEDVAADLERKGLLFDREMYTHRYPVCWRCGTELVFRLVDEWLISMDQLRHQMIEAARSATWLPSFGLERELDWLRNMDDWMISKKRYWGLALPIYPCAACGQITVVGSKEELRERAVAGWKEFEGHSPHRPWVDAVAIACAGCGAPVERVADVGNPWLDAGIVGFSTLHYRSDRAYWERWFPADLVLESFPGQFRNWFYALLAMSTALEGRAPFKTLLGYALVKDERGEEMHKSKGNAIPFEDAAGWRGVEPLRWLFASAPPERNILLGRGAAEETARRLQPLWEVYRFFVTYANLEPADLGLAACLSWRDTTTRPRPAASLDRWLIARLSRLVAAARQRLDGYDARDFTLEVETFLDDLSNWYVRRSRRRFWRAAGAADEAADKRAAYATLYTALVTLARLLAPVLPFLAETLYQNLVRSVDPAAPESVHLSGYPVEFSLQGAEGDEDDLTLDGMEVVRRAVALGRAARRGAGVKVRQPLRELWLRAPTPAAAEGLRRFEAELRDELNVKSVRYLDSSAELVEYRFKPNLRVVGKKYGKLVPALTAALGALSGETARLAAHAVEAGRPVALAVDGQTLELLPEELLVETSSPEGLAVAEDDGLLVALDTALTPELREEGLARELVRNIQDARKNAGFAIADSIAVYLSGGEGQVAAAVRQWGDYIRGETLATELAFGAPPAHAHTDTLDLDGATVTVAVARR